MDYQQWAQLLMAATKSESIQETFDALIKLEVECYSCGESVVGEFDSSHRPLELRCPKCKEGWIELS